MKNKFRQFPQVLQKQILIRLTAGIISLLMLVIILLYRGGIELMFPCIGFSSVFFISALHLFARCDEKNYVVIKGTCTEIEKTGLRRKVKDIYVKDPSRKVRKREQLHTDNADRKKLGIFGLDEQRRNVLTEEQHKQERGG